MGKLKDDFEQFMYLNVTMSAADTLTFSEVSLGLSLFDYAGLVIARIEYFPDKASVGEIVGANDAFRIALTGSNSLTSLSQNQPQVYDLLQISANPTGTPGNFEMYDTPYIHDFTGLGGGGILVPAQNMYIAADTDNFTAAGIASMRVYFRVKQLQAGDFVELVQRLRVLST